MKHYMGYLMLLLCIGLPIYAQFFKIINKTDKLITVTHIGDKCKSYADYNFFIHPGGTIELNNYITALELVIDNQHVYLKKNFKFLAQCVITQEDAMRYVVTYRKISRNAGYEADTEGA